jgi:iron-sulfur cluster assembly protein
MATTHDPALSLTLTEKALAKVKEYLAAEDLPAETGGLRVGVMPGGCSGFRYEMSVDDSPAEDDIVLDVSGVRVFVDPFSAQYLNGVSIDYVTSMTQSGFAFENPNSTGGCGCGSSFAV